MSECERCEYFREWLRVEQNALDALARVCGQGAITEWQRTSAYQDVLMLRMKSIGKLANKEEADK